MMFAHNPLAPVVAGDRPSLSIDFTRAATLKQAVLRGAVPMVFNRASVALRENPAGALESLAIDGPRFDYQAGKALGLRAENSRTNLCTNDNTDATGLTNITLGGPGAGSVTLEALDDATKLTAAGLGAVVTGKVVHIDNTSGSGDVDIQFSLGGQLGNTNPHSLSAWVRGSGNIFWRLSGTNFGNIGTVTGNYQRFKIDGLTPPSQTLNTMKLRVLLGAEAFVALNVMEAGGFASSSIASNGAAQTTRAAEVSRITALSPWFNASAGTFITTFRTPPADDENGHFVLNVSNGTVNNRFGVRIDLTGADNIRIQTKSTETPTDDAFLSLGNLTGFDAEHRIAAFYDAGAGTVGGLLNGGALMTDLVNTPAGLSRLDVGGRLADVFLDATIARLDYYPRALPEARMRSLTQ